MYSILPESVARWDDFLANAEMFNPILPKKTMYTENLTSTVWDEQSLYAHFRIMVIDLLSYTWPI